MIPFKVFNAINFKVFNKTRGLSLRNFSDCNVLSTQITKKEGQSFSSLYISGRYGEKLYPTAIPHFDFDYILSNFSKLQDNWKRRHPKITLNESVKIQINELGELNKKIKELSSKVKGVGEADVNKKQELSRNLKKLFNEKWDVEELVIPILLRLPNYIHARTLEENEILQEFGEKSTLVNPKSYLDIGLENRYLEFTDASPNGFYVLGPLANLELEIVRYVTAKLIDAGINMISLPNMVKSAIVEASGNNPFSVSDIIRIREKNPKWGNALHLAGSSSLEAFLSYFTRMRLNSEDLPFAFFNIGRKYRTRNITADAGVERNLIASFQSTEISVFAVDLNECMSLKMFDKLCSVMEEIYTILQVPFRTKQCSVTNLKDVESLRVEFEVWFPHLKKYVKCGHLSLYEKYFSQKLMMTHDGGFQSQCGGSIVNVSVLLACIMENFQCEDGKVSFPKYQNH